MQAALSKLTGAAFKQEVENAEGRVAADFYADWCGPCQSGCSRARGAVVEVGRRRSIRQGRYRQGRAYTNDIRGRMGNRVVRQHFQTVRLEARAFSSESEERLREVVEETEARCPFFNLISDAGVRLETLWVREEID